MFGFHGGRGCGPQQGSWRRGPIEVRWEVEGGRGRGRGGGGGRRRRMFDGDELRLVLLKLIADQPRHGYELIRDIEERTDGAYAPSPGVIYPTLTMLDEMGLVEEAKTEGARKQFAATEAGRAHLTEREAEVTALLARLEALGAESSRVDRAPIRRAMGNLSAVLQHRIGGGDLSIDTLHDIAGLIDEVARKIERL